MNRSSCVIARTTLAVTVLDPGLVSLKKYQEPPKLVHLRPCQINSLFPIHHLHPIPDTAFVFILYENFYYNIFQCFRQAFTHELLPSLIMILILKSHNNY